MTLWPLVLAVVFWLVLLAWFVYRVGRQAGRVEALTLVGREFDRHRGRR